jgi:hypothetical protein
VLASQAQTWAEGCAGLACSGASVPTLYFTCCPTCDSVRCIHPRQCSRALHIRCDTDMKLTSSSMSASHRDVIIARHRSAVPCQGAELTSVSAHSRRCHNITHSFTPNTGENTYFAFSTREEGLQSTAFNYQDAVDSW